jgi:hypothetical protein
VAGTQRLCFTDIKPLDPRHKHAGMTTFILRGQELTDRDLFL